MKNRSFRRLPLLCAVISGLVGWLLYPALLMLVSAPIEQIFVPRMPSETFFHQLQTSWAFSGLGLLVPTAAILISRSESNRIFQRNLIICSALSLLIAALTAFFMYAQLVQLSGFVSQIELQNPGIPTQSNYSMISLYRIGTYPSYIMICISAYSLVSAYKTKKKKDNKSEQATPRKPSD